MLKLGKKQVKSQRKGIWKNVPASISVGYILLVLIIAVFAYAFIPDKTKNANQVRLELALKPPGYQALIFKQSIGTSEGERDGSQLFFPSKRQFKERAISSYQVKGDSLVIYPMISEGLAGLPEYFKSSDLGLKDLSSESLEDIIQERKMLLGTDKLGRDMLSRLILGSRISLSVGFTAVLISLIIGLILGSLAGYFGSWVDQSIMWFVNVFWSVPTLLWVIAISLALGKGLWQVYVAIGLSMWVDVARMVRGQVMGTKSLQYAEAGSALGYSNLRVLFRHVLPNSLSPVIVIAASNFATAILLEAGLSFLGLGAQPPIPSWGNMIKDHYAYIIMDKAYLAYLPGLAIMSLVLAFMIIGNALRDSLDVKAD